MGLISGSDAGFPGHASLEVFKKVGSSHHDEISVSIVPAAPHEHASAEFDSPGT